MRWIRDTYNQARDKALGTHTREAAERAKDDSYQKWAEEQGQGQPGRNPPKSRMLDAKIAEFAREFPEFSGPDQAQAEIDADATENWDAGMYPPYEGPGYTEPPVNWEGWHQPHSAYEKDHYWDTLTREPEPEAE